MIHIGKAPSRKLPPLDARERIVAQSIVRARRAIMAATSEAKLVAALEARNADAALDAIGWAAGEAVLRAHLPDQYRLSHEAGAAKAAKDLTASLKKFRKASDLGYAFDGKNPHASTFASQRAAELIREFGLSSREAIAEMIARAFEEGITPRDLARLIRLSGIGLTTRQASALERLRASLIEQGLSAAKVEARTARYAEQLLRDRAEAIARTEIIYASRAGAQATWEEAASEGLIDKATAKQVWIASPDACEKICLPLDDTTAPLGGTFGGGLYGPPGHPQCRCALALRPE